MKGYSRYVSRLAALVEQYSDGRRVFNQVDIAPALDGEPSRVLRELISLDNRRNNGVFFTGSILADRVAGSLAGHFSKTSVIVDPCCGAGDLLLACARYLPASSGLLATLESWGACLRGTDLHEEFIDAAKLRLVLQALAAGAQRRRVSRDEIANLFPGIRVGNCLHTWDDVRNASHIITNPPFTMIDAPRQCEWTNGATNFAALFLDKATQHMESGTRIRAILPDVLRSGSRYAEWRRLIQSRIGRLSVALVGRFSRHADVDVFLLSGQKRPSQHNSASNTFDAARPSIARRIVADKFAVHVGPVVPHRHNKRGPQYPYITPHNCPPWQKITDIDTTRRFSGTVYGPPFVVVRRTSRTNDHHRAVGTIIAGRADIAVENHLLVLKPHSGTLRDCHRLLTVLRSDATDRWLNQRICCRHLTVSAVRGIPWSLETA